MKAGRDAGAGRHFPRARKFASIRAVGSITATGPSRNSASLPGHWRTRFTTPGPGTRPHQIPGRAALTAGSCARLPDSRSILIFNEYHRERRRKMSSGVDDRLAVLDHVTVNRADGSAIFRDLSCTFRAGEACAIVGPTGSGKTILADLLSGRRRPDSGTISWPRFDDPASAIHRVAFKEDSWLFSYSRHYYQQRFNFIEPHDDLTLAGFLRAGSSASEEAVAALAE